MSESIQPAKDFRMTCSAVQTHKHSIYCVAWSTDVYRDQFSRRTENIGSTEGVSSRADRLNLERSTMNSSVSGDGQRPQSRLLRCLATCAGNQVTIYEVEVSPEENSQRHGELELRQVYMDPDDKEDFYACVFGGRCLGRPFGYAPEFVDSAAPIALTQVEKRRRLNETVEASNSREKYTRGELYHKMVDLNSFDGPQLLCVGGKRGIIKVIDTVRRMLFLSLSGHGDDIYDLKLCPTNQWLLLSASKDESLRLWNLKQAACVAIFAGHEGHRDAVLSVAWHCYGDRFVSGGMDTTVKLWNIGEGTAVYNNIQASKKIRPRLWDSAGDSEPKETFRTIYEQMPYFSTKKCHVDYVDCVQFVGDLVLSKSIDNDILLWKPVLNKARRSSEKEARQRLPDEVVALREYKLSHADVWFVRFDTNTDCTLLACGNTAGEIRVWGIEGTLRKKPITKLIHQYCVSSIRMVSFSPDGKSLVAACDDSTIWKWDAA